MYGTARLRGSVYLVLPVTACEVKQFEAGAMQGKERQRKRPGLSGYSQTVKSCLAQPPSLAGVPFSTRKIHGHKTPGIYFVALSSLCLPRVFQYYRWSKSSCFDSNMERPRKAAPNTPSFRGRFTGTQILIVNDLGCAFASYNVTEDPIYFHHHRPPTSQLRRNTLSVSDAA